MAYLREGARCDALPHFGPTMKIFLQATSYEKVRFLPFFLQEFGEFAASIERSEAKSVSALGGKAP